MLKINKKVLSLTLVLLLAVIVVAGCTGNGNDEQISNGEFNGEGLTGRETYSGEWSGSIMMEDFSGTWQFEVDFDEGNVEGWFEGDGAGDITGTFSDGVISAEAEGGAAFGTVEWSGDFSSDGEEVSGTWEGAGDIPGSGTWSGSIGELEDESLSEGEGEDEIPEEDQVDGDEPVARYPGSVMLSYESYTVPEGSITSIDYGTEDGLDEVVDWYKGELGEPTMEEVEADETALGFILDEVGSEYVEITVSTEDYTIIEVEHVAGTV